MRGNLGGENVGKLWGKCGENVGKLWEEMWGILAPVLAKHVGKLRECGWYDWFIMMVQWVHHEGANGST